MTLTPRMALTNMAATFAYLGLAVLGWGGVNAFFSHPALIAVAAATLVMPAVAFTSGNLSPGVREDRTNRWVIAAFGIIGLLAAYLPAYADRKGFWTFDGILFAGLAFSSMSSAGLQDLAGFCAGRRFSGLVAIQPGPHACHDRRLRYDPQPQLSGVTRQLTGVGFRFSFGVGDSSRPSSSRCSWRASARRRPCCTPSLAASTRRTAPARGGLSRGSTEPTRGST